MHKLLMVFLFLWVYVAAMGQDSLLYHNGELLQTAQEWEQQKKAVVQQQVLNFIYGHMPAAAQQKAVLKKQFVIKEQGIQYREIDIALQDRGGVVARITLAVFTPADSLNKVPVILALNKCGNAEVSFINGISIDTSRMLHAVCSKAIKKYNGSYEALRGMKEKFWSIDTIIKRGFGFATFHESDIVADVNRTDIDIFKHYPELQHDTGWGVVAAWAWGLQRAVDYLVTDSLIDKDKIVLFGHSRRGKAALLAAAMDSRVAMVVPHQSGTGGMALSKEGPLESVRQITNTFPAWFNKRFRSYAANTNKLPLDQHYVVAMVAPRIVLETVGTWDIWSSFRLSVKTMHMASPVYELYGKKGVEGKGIVYARDELWEHHDANLLQVRRPYKHDMNSDYWNYILDFATMKFCSCDLK